MTLQTPLSGLNGIFSIVVEINNPDHQQIISAGARYKRTPNGEWSRIKTYDNDAVTDGFTMAIQMPDSGSFEIQAVVVTRAGEYVSNI